jgi:CheY-like chemotaxis protein
MVTQEAFVGHVREALANLHNPTALQTSPLAELLGLVPEPSGGTVARLRETLREAVQALKPTDGVPSDRAEWLGYQLLWQSAVQLRSRYDVCDDLGISRSSFYRFRQQATLAVALLLWERLCAPSGRADQAPADNPDQRARDEALRLALGAKRQRVDVAELLVGIEQIVRPLCAQRGIALRSAVDQSLPATSADPATLRQVLLGVLTEGIERAPVGAVLQLAARADPQTLTLALGAAWPQPLAGARIELARQLLALYGGTVASEPGLLRLSLPLVRQPSVLIIDDDADTVRLYRTYLRPAGLDVTTVSTAAELNRQLATATPDLVLLDVLMPQWDGWDVLLRLRTWPETASVPVVVCSVLHEPELALALGASRVLRKPISQETLWQTVQAFLPQADSEAAPHPIVL